jgi:hypothetical protein
VQVRFEVADALLNSHITLGAACGSMQPRQEQNAADQAASAQTQRRCLQLLHRACVVVPQLGPVGIACQAAEASRLKCCCCWAWAGRIHAQFSGLADA